MAIVATAAYSTPTCKTWNLTALDADTTVDVTHGMAATPALAILQMRGAAIALAAGGNWSLGTIDATKVTVNKLNTAGSGGAAPGTTVVATLIVQLPHSIL